MRVDGKVLVFTDLHVGLKSDSLSRLQICENVVNQIVDRCKKDCIKNCFFLGDFFHSRNSINVQTLDVANRCMELLTKNVHVYFCLGNHDIFNKNTVDVNSINIFRDKPNFTLIDKTTEIDLNGQKILMCPWLADYTGLKADSYDLLFGHFDIPADFLIEQYKKDNRTNNKSSSSVSKKIDGDDFFKDVEFETEETIGDYIDLLKERGTIYSGHIHGRREFKVRGRKFVFVGSPYQQNFGDMDRTLGYYVLDEDNNSEFTEIKDVPRHVILKISDIENTGVDNFDFSIVSGNIVKKNYDVEIDRVEDSRITQKITDFKPFEETVPDYTVTVDFSVENGEETTIDVMQKSEIEYLHNYIDNIDQKSLENEKIDPKRLYGIMSEYYNKVKGL